MCYFLIVYLQGSISKGELVNDILLKKKKKKMKLLRAIKPTSKL